MHMSWLFSICSGLLLRGFMEQTLVFVFSKVNEICKVDTIPDKYSGRKLRVAYLSIIDFSLPLLSLFLSLVFVNFHSDEPPVFVSRI